MPRLMSVALTEQAVRDRRKTVTRRLGWATLQPGTDLDLCRKVMGRRHRAVNPPHGWVTDPLVRVARVRVIDVRRECLHAITPQDVRREGFADGDLWEYGGLLTPLSQRFVTFFCEHMRVLPSKQVTRIEWEYLPTPDDWPPL